MMRLVWMLGLVSCLGDGRFIGDEIANNPEDDPGGGGDDDDYDTDEWGELVISADFTADCEETDGSSLTLTGGVGEFEVLHVGVTDNCCAEWSLTTDVDEDQITATYTDDGELCDCECEWTFSYTITGVAPGDWVVVARQDQETVTVE
jgi:hypothetical protein